MKTLSNKTNPAFKLVQPLPMLPSIPPLRAVSATIGLPQFTPPAGSLCRKMTDIAACALNVSQSFSAPAVRAMS